MSIATELNTAAPTLADGRLEPQWEGDAEMIVQIQSLLAAPKRCGTNGERRRDRRMPFPRLLHLTPVDRRGEALQDQGIVAVGKHLSEQGIGFFHHQPLPHRRMIVSLEVGEGTWVGLLIDLSWCRFTRHGWYESGGRFLKTVPSPLADGAPA